jgi:MYXO-CTERM domain-containing protein
MLGRMARPGTIISISISISALTIALAHRPADACGMFIAKTETARFNDALQFVVVRAGTRVSMVVQNRYRGPVESFALLIPVPQVLKQDNVKTLDRSVFDAFEKATAPTLHYMEERDPCYDPNQPPGGSGGGADGTGARGKGGVAVEASFVVGEYQVAVLSATEATALEDWLAKNEFKIPPGSAEHLRPYVDGGSKFFVAKVDPAKVKFENGEASLSPLRFDYDAETVSLPVRLSVANSAGSQDVIVYAINQTRMVAANRPNRTIPINLELTKEAAADFGGFYAALFDRAVKAEARTVVTEAAITAFGSGVPPPALEAVGMPIADTQDWVLSRLHFRVDKAGSLDDVVLKDAIGIVGAKVWEPTPSQVPVEHTNNDFRATYVVKTPWAGTIACDKPERGVYFMARANHGEITAPRLAKASAKTLDQLVATDIPTLMVKAAPPAAPAETPAAPVEAKPQQPEPKKKSGCGCAGAGGTGDAALVVLVVAGLGRNRRRRRVVE